MFPLAQIDPNNLADGLAKNPLAWLLVVALFSLAYLFRELRAEQEKRIVSSDTANKELQGVLREIIPMSTKLTDAVGVLDRALDKLNEAKQ